jgi:hypothetical protein
MTYEQPEDEVQAQVGENSNGEFVLAWFGTVLDHRDWVLAVQFMGDDMRHLHASKWAEEADQTGELLGHLYPAVVAALAEPDPTHACWDAYAEANLRWYAEQFGDFMDNIAIGSRPRPLGPNLEGFILVDYSKVVAPEIEVDGVPRRQTDERPQPAAVRVAVQMTDLGPRIESWSPGPAFPGTLESET